MNDTEPKAAQPGRYFKIGAYRFEFQPNRKWGAADGSRGVANHRTPWGAAFALRSWRREWRRTHC